MVSFYALSLALPQVATTTTLAASANPSTTGQLVTFTATVSPNASASGTPTGTVTFFDNGTQIGASTLDANGNANYSTSGLAAGDHTITAVYGGDANFTGSTSADLDQTVNPAVSQGSTTTTLAASANPSTFDQSVTFTVTVSRRCVGIGHADGYGDVLRQRDADWRQHAGCQRQRQLFDFRTGGRRSHDHRGLRRRRKLHGQHVRGPRPDGQSGRQPGLNDHNARGLGRIHRHLANR